MQRAPRRGRHMFVMGMLGTTAALAACTTFSSDAEAPAGDGGNESATEAGNDAADAAASDAADAAFPGRSCPAIPAAPPCDGHCGSSLAPLPAVADAASTTNARIAVSRGVVYVARVTDASSVSVYRFTSGAAPWLLLATVPAAAIYSLAVDDTTVLLSLRRADNEAPGNTTAAIDVSCSPPCAATMVTVPGAATAGPGMVAIDGAFYFSAATAVMKWEQGTVSQTASSPAGAPVLAGNCSKVYWSAAAEAKVHGYDPALQTSKVVGDGVGLGPDAGPFPGALGLAASADLVFATAGNGSLYALKETNGSDPGTVTAIAAAPLGSKVVADARSVYSARLRQFPSYDVVRMGHEGSAPVNLGTVTGVVDMTSDGDFVYTVDATGLVTKIRK